MLERIVEPRDSQISVCFRTTWGSISLTSSFLVPRPRESDSVTLEGVQDYALKKKRITIDLDVGDLRNIL